MDLGEPVKRLTVVPLKNPVPETAPNPSLPVPTPQAPAKQPEKVPAE